MKSIFFVSFSVTSDSHLNNVFYHLKAEINWKYVYTNMICVCTGYVESTLMPSECVNGYVCGSEVMPCSHDGTTLLGTSRHSPSLKILPGTDSSLTPSLTHPCMDRGNVRKEGKKGRGATYADIPLVSLCYFLLRQVNVGILFLWTD